MKKRIIKIFILIVISLFSFYYSAKFISKIKIDLDEETLDILLESNNDKTVKRKFVNKIVSTINNTEIVNPVSLIVSYYGGNKEKKDDPIITKPVIKDNKDQSETSNSPPIIYIYNTHQGEKYSSTKEINLNYSVLDASNYLNERLKKYNINSIVEKGSIQDVLNANNWKYASSYRVSRMYLEEAKKKTKTLSYFIDLHRDSVKKSISTIEIKGKKYAKVMLLLGLENESYKENEKVITKLNDWLNENYKGISRGIYRKEGKGVNGVYNQDFSSNCILIEVGGEENTYEEVENTIDVLAEMINYWVGEAK